LLFIFRQLCSSLHASDRLYCDRSTVNLSINSGLSRALGNFRTIVKRHVKVKCKRWILWLTSVCISHWHIYFSPQIDTLIIRPFEGRLFFKYILQMIRKVTAKIPQRWMCFISDFFYETDNEAAFVKSNDKCNLKHWKCLHQNLI